MSSHTPQVAIRPMKNSVVLSALSLLGLCACEAAPPNPTSGELQPFLREVSYATAVLEPQELQAVVDQVAEWVRNGETESDAIRKGLAMLRAELAKDHAAYLVVLARALSLRETVVVHGFDPDDNELSIPLSQTIGSVLVIDRSLLARFRADSEPELVINVDTVNGAPFRLPAPGEPNGMVRLSPEPEADVLVLPFRASLIQWMPGSLLSAPSWPVQTQEIVLRRETASQKEWPWTPRVLTFKLDPKTRSVTTH